MEILLFFTLTHFNIHVCDIKEFSHTQLVFHGQYLRNFHRSVKNFMDRYQKISENFHGRRFDFHGKKSAAWVHTYAQYTRARTYPRAYAYAYARTNACVRWRTHTCVCTVRTCKRRHITCVRILRTCVRMCACTCVSTRYFPVEPSLGLPPSLRPYQGIF